MLSRGRRDIRDEFPDERFEAGDGDCVGAGVEVDGLLEVGFIPVFRGEGEGGEVVDERPGEDEEEEGGEVVGEAVQGGCEGEQEEDGEGGEEDVGD